MCQYFYKPAGVVIDKEKFINSVENNPHGWGLIHRKTKKDKWEYMECSDPTVDTDPESLYKIVNENLKDCFVVVHLRWVTAGERNKNNIHPHVVFEQDGKKVYLVHNGTIYGYNNDKEKSDTVKYIEEVLNPIFSCLKNPFDINVFVDTKLGEFIDDDIGNFSRFILASDECENVVLINADAHYFDDSGWIAANSYSFEKGYRERKNQHTVVNNNIYNYSGYRQYQIDNLKILETRTYPVGSAHYSYNERQAILDSYEKKGYTNLFWSIYRKGNIYEYVLKGKEPEGKQVIESEEETENKENEDVIETSLKVYFPDVTKYGFLSVKDFIEQLANDKGSCDVFVELVDYYTLGDFINSFASVVNDFVIQDEEGV